MASAWPGACWLGKATAAACREFEVCFRSPRDLYSSESLWARRKLTTPRRHRLRGALGRWR